MPRNGSGTFTRNHDFTADRDAGSPTNKISADKLDTEIDDISSALTASIAKDGQTTPTANLPMGGYKLTGLGNGSSSGDAVNKSQLDAVSAASAPVGSTYVLISNDATLTNDRALAVESGVLSLTDGGAGSSVTLGVASGGLANAKLANMATARLKGRATGSTGAPEDITVTQALDMITGTAAQGDVIYRGASAYERLAAGASGRVLQTNGAGANPAWVAPAAAASQAEMEAATSSAVYATPGRMQYHPGVAKAWAQFTAGASPSLSAAHNVSSVSRPFVGQYTVNFTTAFSSANYAVVVNFFDSAPRAYIAHVIARTTTSCQIGIFTAVTPTYTDTFTDMTIAVYGDQA